MLVWFFIFIVIFSFRSMAASGLNAVIPNTSKVTIFYNGSVHIYDGIPEDKVIIAALRYEY